MLENLVIAVESEAQVVDLGRVAGFMQKVRLFICLYFSFAHAYASGQRWQYISAVIAIIS